MSLLSFNANEVAPQTPREAWPKGKYRVVMTQSEVKESGAKGSGNRGLHFGCKALEMLGAPQGFQIPGSLLLGFINIHHSNPEAQRIGQSELSSICHATGVMVINDTSNLHGHEFVVDVDTEFLQAKNEDQSPKFDAQGKPEGTNVNRIKGYYKPDGSPIVSAAKPGAVPAAAGPPAAWAAAFKNGPGTQAPAPAPTAPPPPVAATPITLPPTPVAAPPQQFYVNHGGVNHHVVGVDGLRAKVTELNVPAETVNVNVIGSPEWKKASEILGVSVAAAPAPAPAVGGTPPWEVAQQQ